MRRLFPEPADDIDVAAAYAVDEKRHVRANFVASVDGSVSLAGKSAGLSSPADRQLFHLLRSMSDVVLVGAGTARVENYGGAREADGHAPPIAVVTRSLDLDPAARLFTDTVVRPIIVTCSDSPADRRDRLSGLMVLLALACIATALSPMTLPDWLPWTVWGTAGGIVSSMAALPLLARYKMLSGKYERLG